jgi:hypothetical protein
MTAQDLDLGFWGLPAASVNAPSLYYRERCVTSVVAWVADPKRRTRMSLTIKTASMIRRTVVTVLRARAGATSRPADGFTGMMRTPGA